MEYFIGVDSSSDFNSDVFICRCCGKQFNGGEIILGNFYCPMCASIIHKNNGDKKSDPPIQISHSILDFISEPCKHCKNHPSNGGSGICHCILGQKVFY